jgi:ATP-binding cassette subfamily B protein
MNFVSSFSLFLFSRLSTVVNCDKILVLEGGRVVESGSHAELLANPASKYAG